MFDDKFEWSGFLGSSEFEAIQLGGGRNNKVFRVILSDGSRFVAKRYIPCQSDKRDRMLTEVSTLTLMRENGVDSVPMIAATDWNHRVVLLEFIEGDNAFIPGDPELDQAADFLIRLKHIGTTLSPKNLVNPASEAFFNVRDIIGNIRFRLARFEKVHADCPFREELETFLKNDLAPSLDFYADKCRKMLKDAGISPMEEIDLHERMLSPSDFGFHNAVKSIDGHLYFLDFEYFGWDDPAKTLCDFAMHPHPSMKLDDRAVKRFTRRLLKALPGRRSLSNRAAAYYPLFRLKWSLIMLNEFIPDDWERRAFSKLHSKTGNTTQRDERDMLATQLRKALLFYQELKQDYDGFLSNLA